MVIHSSYRQFEDSGLWTSQKILNTLETLF
jgi:hypothetical protein